LRPSASSAPAGATTTQQSLEGYLIIMVEGFAAATVARLTARTAVALDAPCSSGRATKKAGSGPCRRKPRRYPLAGIVVAEKKAFSQP
jgi:hypothetical protein